MAKQTEEPKPRATLVRRTDVQGLAKVMAILDGMAPDARERSINWIMATYRPQPDHDEEPE